VQICLEILENTLGGRGSGWPSWKPKRCCVEDCLVLSIQDLERTGMIGAKPTLCAIVWPLRYSWEGEALVRYAWIPEEGGGKITLDYTFNPPNGRHRVNEPIDLIMTWPNFGGYRWMFKCPLKVEGRECVRLVSSLYLPSGQRYFGCRHCHDLTYRSSQQAHRVSPLDRVLKKLTDLP
jgi:hypothetical protein